MADLQHNEKETLIGRFGERDEVLDGLIVLSDWIVAILLKCLPAIADLELILWIPKKQEVLNVDCNLLESEVVFASSVVKNQLDELPKGVLAVLKHGCVLLEERLLDGKELQNGLLQWERVEGVEAILFEYAQIEGKLDILHVSILITTNLRQLLIGYPQFDDAENAQHVLVDGACMVGSEELEILLKEVLLTDKL